MTLSAKKVNRNNLNIPIKNVNKEPHPKEKKRQILNETNQKILEKLTGGGFIKIT